MKARDQVWSRLGPIWCFSSRRYIGDLSCLLSNGNRINFLNYNNMVSDLQEFWDDNYYNHPPLTDDMVEEAQKRLGVSLPSELIDLLRIQNGGYTKGFAHPMAQRTTWSENHVPLNDLIGIVTDPEHQTAQNILQTEYMKKEWGLPPKQVLLSGDGHWWITLDYRQGAEPSVAWIDVECSEDVQVAPSFRAFLAGLVPSETYED